MTDPFSNPTDPTGRPRGWAPSPQANPPGRLATIADAARAMAGLHAIGPSHAEKLAPAMHQHGYDPYNVGAPIGANAGPTPAMVAPAAPPMALSVQRPAPDAAVTADDVRNLGYENAHALGQLLARPRSPAPGQDPLAAALMARSLMSGGSQQQG
jgi:hypothetical protein